MIKITIGFIVLVIIFVDICLCINSGRINKEFEKISGDNDESEHDK